ncbi:rhamnogalacturonan acetylesterase [Salipaludibacillus sp. CF4.18]|uniref:rhamnogalacturonan acetylesterase n=1 Tax=Salipaludibacillus sp. CF4.18 TaxID=3373081 RepID=UPI003EE6D946
MTRRKRLIKKGLAIALASVTAASVFTISATRVNSLEVPLQKRYDFGPSDSSVVADYLKVTEESIYSKETGYGFSDIANVMAIYQEEAQGIERDFISYSNTAFLVDLPNGDYTVSVVSGDIHESTEFGIKAESIQKVENTSLHAGQITESDFEIAVIDGQLSIELTGDQPKINAIVITKLPNRQAAKHPTVYVASDSTAQTYKRDLKPQAGWGQMLPSYFNKKLTIANHAIGGRSSRTFYTEGRLDNILRELKPRDFVLIQFGHNDATSFVPERYTPVADFKEYMKTYVTGVRQRAGIPILITPVGRRDFDTETEKFNTSFPEYKQAMEEISKDLDVLLVDLNTSSREYYDELGPEGTRSVFLHVDEGTYSAFPEGKIDDTHFQEYGADQIAKLLSEGLVKLDTTLAEYYKL